MPACARILLVVLFSSSVLAAPRTPPPKPDNGVWRHSDPSSLGMDVAAVRDHETLCEESRADACLVVYRGAIVTEYEGPRFRIPMYAMSSTKSVTSLLVGMLIADGRIPGLDTPVSRYIPSWSEGDKAKVTLRHLMTHTSGLKRRMTRQDGSIGWIEDKNPAVIGLPLSWPPGTRFDYSNEGVQLLSPVLDAAAGEPIQRYARRRLFEPLGLRSTSFMVDSKGHAWTYADLKTTPRELARIGLLLLRGGVWRGARIVPEDWIALSTSAATDLESTCGLLWWRIARPRGFAARGYLDTNLYVFPGRDLVVVRMQAKPSPAALSYEPAALALFERMAPRDAAPPL
jgi:CubicO group peptidase (beta-lactamase class C family)